MSVKSKIPAKSTPPVAAGQLFESVAALHLEGKAEEALARIEQALEAGEHQPEVYAAAGYLQYERKDFKQAVAAYQKLVDLDPANGTGWFNLAAALQALGSWEDAAAAFEKALAADGNRYEAHLGRGSAGCNWAQRVRRSKPMSGACAWSPISSPPNSSRCFLEKPWRCSC